MRLQAAQLASHLRKQQTSVDHREAELNARFGPRQPGAQRAALANRTAAGYFAPAGRARNAAAGDRRARKAVGGDGQFQRRSAQPGHGGDSPTHARLGSARSNAGCAVGRAEFGRGTARTKFRVLPQRAGRSRRALEQRHEQLNARQRELDQRQAQRDEEVRQAAAEMALGRETRQLQEATLRFDSRQQHLDDAERLLSEQQAQLESEAACGWTISARRSTRRCTPNAVNWPKSAARPTPNWPPSGRN